MAKAKVGAAGIEYIQGALKRPKKMNGHNHGNYLVATHRSAPTQNPDCQRLYSFDADRYKRTTPLTENDLTARELFRARARWIKTRMEDLSKVTTDQAAFIAQKNEAGGAKTLKAYYWKLAKEQIDENSLNG